MPTVLLHFFRVIYNCKQLLPHRFSRFILFVSLIAISLPNYAADDLSSWRKKLTSARTLAENNAPRAYTEAQRLQTQYPANATPTDRARMLNLLARIETYLALTDQAALHAEQAMAIAISAGDPIGQAESDLNQALTTLNQGDIDKHIQVTTHALKILEGMSRSDLLGEALLRAGLMYRRIGKLEDSITLLMQAMEIAKRTRDPLMLAYAHQGMAIALDQSNRAAEARTHYLAMRDAARAAHSKLLEAYALSGVVNMAMKLNNTADSELVLREAIVLYREIGNPYAMTSGLYTLTTFLQSQGRFAEALPVFDEMAAIYVKYPHRIGEWFMFSERGKVYLQLNRRADAAQDIQRAYEIAKNIGFWLYLSESHKQLANLAALAGDYAEAYRQSTAADDVRFNYQQQLANLRITELTKRYEDESHQRAIAELTRSSEKQQAELRHHALLQRWMWTILIGSLLLLLVSIFFVVRLRNSNALLKETNIKLQLSRNEQRQQTKLLQSVLDSMAEAMMVISKSGELQLANPAFLKYFGPDSSSEAVADELKKIHRTSSAYLPDQVTRYPFEQLPIMRALKGEHVAHDELYIKTTRLPETYWINCSAHPLRDDEDQICGAVAVFSDVTVLKKAQINLEKSHDQLRALIARHEQSREEERKRIAHEIHDELGQLLTALRMRFAMLRMQLKPAGSKFSEQTHEIMELIDHIIQTVRHVAAALRPAVIDSGLIPALEWLAQQQTEFTGITCHVQLPAEQTLVIDDERATAIFRIVQESLTNIIRHAQASEVCIRLVIEDDWCDLEVSDNGIGFDGDRLQRKGLGLVGIKERGLMLGGAVDILSSPGHGARIRVRFPSQKNN